jgi:hypothetical protein
LFFIIHALRALRLDLFSAVIHHVDMLASIAFIMGALDQVYVNLFCLLVYALDPPDHNMHVSTIFQPHAKQNTVSCGRSKFVLQRFSEHRQTKRTNEPHCTAAIIGYFSTSLDHPYIFSL